MDKLSYLFKSGKISRIIITEKERYLNFFSNSYRENLSLSKFILKKYPRWSIISGYYAMHDISKLFIADKFGIKIEFNVHEITIEVLKELIKNPEISDMLDIGYKEFIKYLNDLAYARSQRTKVQYYTGTEFMRSKYLDFANDFLINTVIHYISRIKEIKNVN